MLNQSFNQLQGARKKAMMGRFKSWRDIPQLGVKIWKPVGQAILCDSIDLAVLVSTLVIWPVAWRPFPSGYEDYAPWIGETGVGKTTRVETSVGIVSQSHHRRWFYKLPFVFICAFQYPATCTYFRQCIISLSPTSFLLLTAVSFPRRLIF